MDFSLALAYIALSIEINISIFTLSHSVSRQNQKSPVVEFLGACSGWLHIGNPSEAKVTLNCMPFADRPFPCPATAVYLVSVPFPVTAGRRCLERNASHRLTACHPGTLLSVTQCWLSQKCCPVNSTFYEIVPSRFVLSRLLSGRIHFIPLIPITFLHQPSIVTGLAQGMQGIWSCTGEAVTLLWLVGGDSYPNLLAASSQENGSSTWL